MLQYSDTLKFISTHVINRNVINEYIKLCKSGDDVILCIDNTNLNIKSDYPICEKKFYGTNVKCFLFDKNIHKMLKLPNYYFNREIEDFGKIMWYNADYRFYYVKFYFPYYKYYWQLDYDVYCNGDSYKPFFDKYKERNTDLLICNFHGTLKNARWCWTQKIDWLYNNSVDLYGSFFPVCRLENKAISYLYNKRLEQSEKFKSYAGNEGCIWNHCELFVPTELLNGGFKCNTLSEDKVGGDLKGYFQGDKCFRQKDNLLYHPYKGNFIRKNLNILGIKINWLSAVKK